MGLVCVQGGRFSGQWTVISGQFEFVCGGTVTSQPLWRQLLRHASHGVGTELRCGFALASL